MKKFKKAEPVFEDFNSPFVFFTTANVLKLYALWSSNRLVIYSGHDVTNILPIFEGFDILKSLETELYEERLIVQNFW